MSEETTYMFKIENFTPENMPFGRLLEYYAAIKQMVGTEANIHLAGIFEGSHGTKFKVDKISESKLSLRLMEINHGTAPAVAIRAQNQINKMLRDDNTSGQFGDLHGNNIVIFPGRAVKDDESIRIRDTASFIGELYHISGAENEAKVRISTLSDGVVFSTASRKLAKEMRDYLFEEVRVTGRGVWTRNLDDKWEISDFVITDFAPLKRENFKKTVERVRQLGILWPDDVISEINLLEEKNGTT